MNGRFNYRDCQQDSPPSCRDRVQEFPISVTRISTLFFARGFHFQVIGLGDFRRTFRAAARMAPRGGPILLASDMRKSFPVNPLQTFKGVMQVRFTVGALLLVVLLIPLGLGCGREGTRPQPTPSPAKPPPTSQDSSSAADLRYSLFDEKIYDEPIKTQIEQHIIVHGIPTKKELEAEILKRSKSAQARRGFVHHNPATNIYIYVYGTQEQASAGLGLWIGMLAMGPMDKDEPRVLINEARLASLSQQPKERMGLSEQERRQVFREIATSEQRATSEAMARIPDSRIMEQIQLERELGEKYKMELAQKYDLTEDQLGEILTEGVTMGWPR